MEEPIKLSFQGTLYLNNINSTQSISLLPNKTYEMNIRTENEYNGNGTKIIEIFDNNKNRMKIGLWELKCMYLSWNWVYTTERFILIDPLGKEGSLENSSNVQQSRSDFLFYLNFRWKEIYEKALRLKNYSSWESYLKYNPDDSKYNIKRVK